jgi:hypothetical protein
MPIYHIRYNTAHGESDLVWRIFEDGVEYLVRDFLINVPIRGSSTMENGIEKWNVECQGIMRIERGVAYIGPE